MEPITVEKEVWMIVDEDGDFVASHSQDALAELWESEIGELDFGKAHRIVKIVVRVPLPCPVVATVTVPDLPNTATATVS